MPGKNVLILYHGASFRKQVKCINKLNFNTGNNLDNNPFDMLKITSGVFRKLAPVTRVTKYKMGGG